MRKFLFLALVGFACLAADEAEPLPHPEPITQWDASGEYKATFFRTLFVIVGILVVVLIIVWLLKRMSSGRPMMVNHYKNIKILERRPLSPQTILYQLEIGGRQVIIAESKVEVKVLTQFDTLEKGREF